MTSIIRPSSLSTPSRQEREDPDFPIWPQHLLDLAGAFHTARERERRSLQKRFFVLLYTSLYILIKSQAGRFYSISREDLEDMASERSLYLMQRLERGTWDLSGRTPYELYRYLYKVAHTSLIKVCHKSSQTVALEDRPDVRNGPGTETVFHSQPSANPEDTLKRKTFARELRECLNRLNNRSWFIWVLKVFSDLPAAEIARHPRIMASVNQVNVIFHRCRAAIRKCMSDKGFDSGDIQPGVFSEIMKDEIGFSVFVEKGRTDV